VDGNSGYDPEPTLAGLKSRSAACPGVIASRTRQSETALSGQKLIFVFDNYVLDTGRRELRRGHTVVSVQPQVFDLLEYLIRNRGHVVSRDDLLDAVWGGRIVSESTLATRINAARSAIGDDGESQRLIRTLPRRGIRFVGEVREEEEEQPRAPRAAASPSGAVASPLPMAQVSQQIHFCRSRDDTRIAYAICGHGRPLVWAPHWVHHLRFDWESPIWRPWLALLTKHHSLIYYDWRGCGLSDRNGVKFAPDLYLEDFEAVVDAARVDQFALVGIAQGARTAMTYAVRHPGRVSHLALFASSPCGRVVQGQSSEEAAEEDIRLKAVELGWENPRNPAYGRFFTSWHLPDATAEQVNAYNDLLWQTTSAANAVAMMRTFHRADVRDIVSKIRCPTLVLHSRGEFVIPFEWGRAVATLIPEARFVPLESRNHVLLGTEPAWQQMVAALEDFLPPRWPGTETAITSRS